jgi:OOP family OmpA-OmpF porin
MKDRFTRKSTIVAAAAAMFALSAGAARAASADNAGWYAGLDIGRSNLRMNGGDIDSALSNQGIVGSSSIGDHDTSLGADVGYRLNRNFALEGGYIDFGKFGYSSAVSSPAADTVQGDYKAHAWSFSGVGIAPLDDQWAVFGKAGLTRTSADLSASSATGATSPNGVSQSANGLVLGGGATYDFTQNWYGKLELDRYTHVGDANTGRADADVYSLGVGMRF